jgi:hypothetical protein
MLSLPDRLGGTTTAVGEQSANALAPADQIDRLQHGVAAAERRATGSSSSPRSTHSIAKAIVPPALIVSMAESRRSAVTRAARPA